MRLLIYNIAYGTGCPGSYPRQLFTIHRYLRTPRSHLDRVIEFIDGSEADIVGLVEVDTGSYRTNFTNQVEVVANHLKHYHQSSVKYGADTLAGKLPYLRHQANAVLTRDEISTRNFHFFPMGLKRLIIEVEVNGFRFFLVHLELRKRIRQRQLEFLAKLAPSDGPLIIAGDFNTWSGRREIDALREELGLIDPNIDSAPTFPSWKPRLSLDFILCSRDIRVKNFEIPDIRHSDHLPLLLDFDLY